ncbi:MAG: histidinol-phosphatase, partial [Actinobacteria bacterium]|nr:histidinol-phosphatase [Actinomycetota bacterium]
WATLIGLVDGDRPILGLVGAPGLGERYEAVLGQGARLNGEPIRVSDERDLSEALMLSSGIKDWLDGPLAEPYRELARTAYRTRIFGDFWGHVLVARGAAEFMLEPSLRTWDFTAVQVVVEEAGGRMTTFEGDPPTDGGSVLTTNGLLHDEVLRRLRPGL